MILPNSDPTTLGFHPSRFNDALSLAENCESKWPRRLQNPEDLPGMTRIEPVPWNEILGPLKSRGGASGLILRRGKIAGSWGDPTVIEMTFSVTKSYLAVVAGLAYDEGLLPDLDAPVSQSLNIAEFQSGPHKEITWRHLLNQTSEWSGTLFDKPDQVDHYRVLSGDAPSKPKGTQRALQAPGTYYEYNDVRVNLLSFALLHLIKEPLPAYLKRKVMDPIGASDTWRWHGYRNAVVMVGDQQMISVPGGGHWGGGIWINSHDHALFGQLLLQGGTWQGQQILSSEWIELMWQSSPLLVKYGLLWWLNNKGEYYPGLPEDSVFAIGAGGHVIWITPSLDMVVVARWIDEPSRADVFKAILAAIEK